jgi:hypothetical protein
MPRSYERSYYRIPYPCFEGPRLVIGYHVCQVVDCSERGLRYLAPPHAVPGVGHSLAGRLRFPRGAEVEIEGVVIRVRDREVAVRLAEPGVPFRVILQEQIYLRRLRAD